MVKVFIKKLKYSLRREITAKETTTDSRAENNLKQTKDEFAKP